MLVILYMHPAVLDSLDFDSFNELLAKNLELSSVQTSFLD